MATVLLSPKKSSKQQFSKNSSFDSTILSSFILKKFLTHLTKKGKQTKAEKLLKVVFLNLSLRGFSPFSTLVLAINNVKPFIEVRSVRSRGKSFQVPFPIKLSRQIGFAIKTILKSSFGGRNIEERLVEELISSSLGKSSSVKLTANLHKLAFQNRLSTNFRWF